MTETSFGVFAPGCMLRVAGREPSVIGGRKQAAVLESMVPTLQWGDKQARLGLSYDVNVQRLAVPSAGRLELALTWTFGEVGRCVVCSGF